MVIMMKRKGFFVIFILASLVLSACAGAVTSDEKPTPTNSTGKQTNPTSTPAHTPAITSGEAKSTVTLLPEEAPPTRATIEFTTDFSKHSVPYSEILSGGPPKNGIPAIDEPKFVSVNEADSWLRPVEPVILIQAGDEARAYPIQILIWHEIVNDTVGGLPLAVTFCPLCNTAIAFERMLDGKTFDFGTTGRLRYSNLIMYDRQTETWWQQANGEAIAGELIGKRLKFYPAAMISWEEFKSAHPDGLVLSRETGFPRSYGQNPYAGYDDVNNPPFLYRGPETPGVLPPVARVLTVDLNGEAVAYPYEVLQEVLVVNDTVGGQPVAIFWAAGTASALDAGSVAGGRDVGSANAYSRVVDGRELHFSVENGQIVDRETNSDWNLLGQAISGKISGQQLEPIIVINHFWFSWAAFKPETRIYQP